MTRAGRRRFLGLAATAAAASLAGCDALHGTGESTVDGDRLADLAGKDAPTVPERLPVDIEASFVDAQVETARDLLADVPAPFTAEAIPNGAIRQRLNRFHERATVRVEDAAKANSPFERLDSAGHARADARELRASWRAIDADLTVEDVLEDARSVREDADAFADRLTYVGDDPVRGLRVHAELEHRVTGARNWAAFDEGYAAHVGDGPFAVGDAAVDLERARVDVAVGDYLLDRFEASLDAERDLRPTFEPAFETLSDRLVAARESLPADEPNVSPSALLDRDVGETAGTMALKELFRDAWYATKRLVDHDDPDPSVAGNVMEAHGTLTLFGAFDHLRARIEGGDDVAVESAADVERLRAAAVDAVDSARDAADGSGLVAAALPNQSWRVRAADRQFEHYDDEMSVESAAHDVVGYVTTAELCRALPGASDEVASLLREG